LPTWKSAAQQVLKLALRGFVRFGDFYSQTGVYGLKSWCKIRELNHNQANAQHTSTFWVMDIVLINGNIITLS
jgi:hypothetical protein